MMFAKLAGVSCLRDITQQFEGQAKRLYHLGLRTAKRSTLADANARRAEFFEAVFQAQYARCTALAPKKRFHFQNKLYSFDSSVIDLCLSMFPWAKFHRTEGGIKLHTLLDHDGYIPAFVHITIGVAPAYAIPMALKRAGLKLSDLDVMECNEAFAVQNLVVVQELANQTGEKINNERWNPMGGAIAFGHANGASGTRIAGFTIRHLIRTDKRYGLFSACCGGGQVVATVVENVGL